ncbi:MAG TPA: transporter substrate-binding domain-containing protein [Burkholderiaceae bacterium]|nr:transporter substrate-binding domain-containing protein [Burkholderiaceae bacterium]
MRKLTLVGLAALLACLAGAAQASVAPLRLCVDPANLPFSSNAAEDARKGVPGLYVEIGQAVADALGRPLETVWSLSYFGKRNLRATLLANQCDLAVGLPAVQDFMGPRVIFTRPILSLGYALVIAKDRTAAAIDDLKGQRVAVQFGSPPQSLLAARDDIMSVTTMDPEEAMRRLAAGEVDAAFVWGASAAYINHATLQDRFKVIPVDAPQMQFPAAIGLSSKRVALRDEIDALLGGLAPRIQELSTKYLVAMGPAVTVTDAGTTQVAAAEQATAEGTKGDPASGKQVFNGTCAHCHGPDAVVADRKVNLRRLQVKYAEQMDETFFATVTNGRPAKGMPAWKDVFKQEDFVNILAYLKSVQEK